VPNKRWNIAVVGVSSVIGEQLLECLEEWDVPVGTVRLLSDAGEAGMDLEFRGRGVVVEELTHDSFAGIDIVFFCASDSTSREFWPAARQAGAVCIDTGPAWRRDPDVPLVAPEVNPQEIAGFSRKRIVAIPGAMTLQLLAALKPLHDRGTVRRIVVSTYQAVSDSGREAIDELHHQVLELLNGRSPDSRVYPHRIAFNCIPQVGEFRPGGVTEEEEDMAAETRRILGNDVRVNATAARLPLFYGHAASVNIETAGKIGADEARALINRTASCELVDDPGDQSYPMPCDAVGEDQVQVGRIREDDSIENGLNLWLAADNTRQVAMASLRVAELLVERYLCKP
jgi:aspartate-semialdehyde dehydrogenase